MLATNSDRARHSREKDNDHLWGVAVEIHRDGEVERFAGQIMGPRETAEIVAKMFVDQTRDPYYSGIRGCRLLVLSEDCPVAPAIDVGMTSD